jgi:hypothetical protein
MKKLLLALALLAALALPASAYVQPGHLPGGRNGLQDKPRDSDENNDPFTDPFEDGSRDRRGRGSDGAGGEDDPTKPVPEPGTMALAAMGLAALGAASRRRRGN